DPPGWSPRRTGTPEGLRPPRGRDPRGAGTREGLGPQESASRGLGLPEGRDPEGWDPRDRDPRAGTPWAAPAPRYWVVAPPRLRGLTPRPGRCGAAWRTQWGTAPRGAGLAGGRRGLPAEADPTPRWRRSRARAPTRSWRSCSTERFFQELFEGELASQAAAEFEQAMQELAREEPHLVEQFQKLSEAAGRVGSDATSQQEFTSCLKETLSGLAKNATDLQSSSASEEELAKALEGLGLEEGDGEGSVLPVMQSIMQSLLSKDVLYPSLKEITEKYPEWLRQHGEALPAEQYERYRAQHGV
uniref:Peroxisomal biogenesis factor 19 n=1 Tax=Falco tinnunculus TaxID=100819 RepID=A0A8C4U5U1_FALTI